MSMSKSLSLPAPSSGRQRGASVVRDRSLKKPYALHHYFSKVKLLLTAFTHTSILPFRERSLTRPHLRSRPCAHCCVVSPYF